MLEVVAGAGESDESEVASDHDLLRERRDALHAQARRERSLVHVAACGETGVHGVLGDRAPELCNVLHGAPQQTGVGHRVTVVGEEPDAGSPQLVEVSQLPALPAGRDAAGRGDVYEPHFTAPVDDVAGQVPRVDDGVRVRHGDDGRVPAGGRGGRAGGDVLLVLLARLAQVGVEIDEAGRDPGAGSVDLVGGTPGDLRTGLGHHAVGDAHVALDGPLGPEHDAVADDHVTHSAHLPAAGTERPCGRRRRWRPGRGPGRGDHRPRRCRSRLPGSSARGASRWCRA